MKSKTESYWPACVAIDDIWYWDVVAMTISLATDRVMLRLLCNIEIEKFQTRSKHSIAKLKAVYVARRTDLRWGQLFLEGRPFSRVGNVGRSATNWTDDLVKVTGNRWMRTEQDRLLLRFLSKAYVYKWTGL